MTIITFEKEKLEKRIGKLDQKTQEKITMFGTPIDSITDKEISIEVFPNRPDLLSLEGFVRSFNAYLGKKTNIKYEVKDSANKVILEKLPKEWPYAVACIVKNLKFNNDKIKEIIDIQEKLGLTFLRKRKKGGIGLYPLNKITFPVTFRGMKPEEIKFKPLEFPKIITGRQILSQHPTGREYAYICKDWETFPVFIDKKGVIMSMPPIINSHDVGKIDETTTEVFIEATGNNLQTLQQVMNIIACVLADMGGTIYSIDCQQMDKKTITIPNLAPEKIDFSPEYINQNLGTNFSEKEIENYLAKMNIMIDSTKKNIALIPPYRTDILHEIDLVEEIAISHGYENFEPEIPAIATIGEENKMEVVKRKISELLVGLNLLEVSSFHLSTKDKQFKSMGVKSFKDKIIEIENSKTEYNILRTSLIANAVAILSENSDAAYPQKLFEIGKVFSLNKKNETGIEEKEKLCIALCGEKSNFTEIKQIVDYILRMFQVSYSIEETTEDSFIEGRCGRIMINNKEVGILGEISPFVLKNNKIKMPVACLEMDVEPFLN